jgi:hypothetical protein
MDCKFRVWQGGRERVVRSGRKAVHAFVAGSPAGPADEGLVGSLDMRRVSYNPFKNDFFYEVETGAKVETCRWAALLEDGSLWVQK